jgi:hypothetical protein
VCPLKVPIGFSTIGVDHSYGIFEVSKTDKCGKAGTDFFDTPPNTITRPSEAIMKF